MMRRFSVLVLLPLVLLGPLAVPVVSQEDQGEKLRLIEELMQRIREAAENAAPDEGMERFFEEEGKTVLRIYNVADLTVRLTDFTAPNLRLSPAGAEADESQPLFGRADEGDYFFSGPEELMDLLMSNVRPEIWAERGYSMSVSGPFGLVVVADPDVQAEIVGYLSELRKSVGRMVTVEMRVLELDDGALAALPSGPAAASLTREAGLRLLERAEAGQGLRIAHSVRITGFNSQRVALRRGAQRAIVQDYDVEVAENAKIADPIVNLVQTGLAFDVRPVVRGEDQVILDMRARISALREPLSVVDSVTGPLQLPDVVLATVFTTMTVPNRGFALVGASDASGHRAWAILVSATVERVRTTGGGR